MDSVQVAQRMEEIDWQNQQAHCVQDAEHSGLYVKNHAKLD